MRYHYYQLDPTVLRILEGENQLAPREQLRSINRRILKPYTIILFNSSLVFTYIFIFLLGK